jgi:hypothetical protein
MMRRRPAGAGNVNKTAPPASPARPGPLEWAAGPTVAGSSLQPGAVTVLLAHVD